eukprot:CAMPEP_0196216268 /NCGR_PEP_ID=MMETSP0912-20130531/31849_1 /TAXON_ID=49265 /ORGANISM="Thalassiosira rotula, Strain GSO102" /LENGTH=62 /DNA_ID=CAMNT_0041493371 /DNA_START=30 /DNA_END=218 /DNA_ORIENTATION=-
MHHWKCDLIHRFGAIRFEAIAASIACIAGGEGRGVIGFRGLVPWSETVGDGGGNAEDDDAAE